MVFVLCLPELVCSHGTWKLSAAHCLLVKQTVFQVNVIRTSMISYWPSTVQTHLCHRFALQELKSIFSMTMSQLFGPCQAAALGPDSLSQHLSLLLWLQNISASPWTSGRWSGFCSSSCSCPPHSAQNTRFPPLRPQELLPTLLPWTSFLLLSCCFPLFCFLISFFDN